MDKPRPEFPDRPLSAAEVKASLRGELACEKQKFYFDETRSRTERWFVEAVDEEQAWQLYEAEQARFVETIYEDECTDTDILRPGDAGYPS